ncbi:putative uncharacterized protein DDB_G0279653 isoform X2 [Leptidea sinapis]|uniref:putative uncharacterized protein DDB_G0279653 isoform X1 n=1 Tax=Leptidea sinapis TaxID=189913 RepID=UPI00213671A3|nr:putative uncharacterized protein DDB_G0279653 isoform X1 [Leptidea sinapis]XP_050677965.1 putative uncharacterized protein DDB_G0279653 isoform X2 [Leptidea sinapis]
MESETIIIVSVFGGAWLVLMLICIILCTQIASLRRKVQDLMNSGRLRVQKLQMSTDAHHAFNNPGLTPDEELARRGFSMYQGSEEDIESGRGTERQKGGQFVEELCRKIDDRQQRQNQLHGQDPGKHQNQTQNQNNSQAQTQQQIQTQNELPRQAEIQKNQPNGAAPSFLLQRIEDNKKKTRALANPVANQGRQSDTNPNFIY